MTTVIEELVHLDPATLVIRANVRTDVHPDAREFAASIKSRGGAERSSPPTATTRATWWCCAGNAAPWSRPRSAPRPEPVPGRIVDPPAEVDRIVDQMGENLHRAAMREREVRDGVEQLALAGVSAAQIAKRTAIKRTTVDAALAGHDAQGDAA